MRDWLSPLGNAKHFLSENLRSALENCRLYFQPLVSDRPDGKRVVAVIPESTAKAPPPEHEIVMLQNFADELRRRVPLGK